MFMTEHFEGRTRYETNHVVCIDVFINHKHDKNHTFFCQIFLSLDDFAYIIPTKPEFYYNSSTYLSPQIIEKEIAKGMEEYKKFRKELSSHLCNTKTP